MRWIGIVFVPFALLTSALGSAIQLGHQNQVPSCLLVAEMEGRYGRQAWQLDPNLGLKVEDKRRRPLPMHVKTSPDGQKSVHVWRDSISGYNAYLSPTPNASGILLQHGMQHVVFDAISFSPDSSQGVLLYDSLRSTQRFLVIFNTNGTHIRRAEVSVRAGNRIVQPSEIHGWSADSRFIALAVYLPSPVGDLSRLYMAIFDVNLMQFVGEPYAAVGGRVSRVGYAEWSQRGNLLAIVRETPRRIAIVSPEQGEIASHPISDEVPQSQLFWLRWSPKGDYVVITGGFVYPLYGILWADGHSVSLYPKEMYALGWLEAGNHLEVLAKDQLNDGHWIWQQMDPRSGVLSSLQNPLTMTLSREAWVFGVKGDLALRYRTVTGELGLIVVWTDKSYQVNLFSNTPSDSENQGYIALPETGDGFGVLALPMGEAGWQAALFHHQDGVLQTFAGLPRVNWMRWDRNSGLFVLNLVSDETNEIAILDPQARQLRPMLLFSGGESPQGTYQLSPNGRYIIGFTSTQATTVSVAPYLSHGDGRHMRLPEYRSLSDQIGVVWKADSTQFAYLYQSSSTINRYIQQLDVYDLEGQLIRTVKGLSTEHVLRLGQWIHCD